MIVSTAAASADTSDAAMTIIPLLLPVRNIDGKPLVLYC